MHTISALLFRTPLWPAGHLPLKGGDHLRALLSPIADGAGEAAKVKLLISPLEGEMSGRTEGGAKEHSHRPPSVTRHILRPWGTLRAAAIRGSAP